MVDHLEYFEMNKKIKLKAITSVKIIKKNTHYSLLELNPITGRKHQLRKQLYNRGHPVIGDQKYYINSNFPYFLMKIRYLIVLKKDEFKN